MTADDADKFASMLRLVSEQYGKPMSPELIKLYFDGLSHLTLADVRVALNSHVRNTEVGQFMPKIADLIRALDGSPEQAAYAALANINARFKGGTTTELDEPTLAAVIEMGGLRAIGQRNAEEWDSFGHKEFLKRYKFHAERIASEKNAQAFLGNVPAKQIKGGL